MKTIKLLMGMLAIASAVFIAACSDDDDGDVNAGPLNLSSVIAIGTSVNTGEAVTRTLAAGSTTSNVPVNSVFTITFSKDVAASSATSANFSITQGTTAVAATVNAVGPVVTITPSEDLALETEYTLTLTSAIRATDGGLFTQATRSFATEVENEVPLEEGLIAHWMFEDNADDLTGNFNADNSIDIEYIEGRSEAAGLAASFNGTTSIIEIPNAVDLVTTNDFTLSLWLRLDPENFQSDGTTQKGYFVLGFNGFRGFQVEIPGNRANTQMVAQYIRQDETKGSEALWLDATGNLGWAGWTYSQDLTADGGFPAYVDNEWAHLVFVYDSETKVGSAYLNGVLRKSQDFNLWPSDSPVRTVTGLTFNDTDAEGNELAGLGTHLALGFFCDTETTFADFADYALYSNPNHNHFKGELDDVKIYHIAKSAEDVATMYEEEQ